MSVSLLKTAPCCAHSRCSVFGSSKSIFQVVCSSSKSCSPLHRGQRVADAPAKIQSEGFLLISALYSVLKKTITSSAELTGKQVSISTDAKRRSCVPSARTQTSFGPQVKNVPVTLAKPFSKVKCVAFRDFEKE